MFNVGDKVRFISEKMHAKNPKYYPPVGTIGEIISKSITTNYAWCVRWQKGSTSLKDEWNVKEDWIELLTEVKEDEAIQLKMPVKSPLLEITVGDTITINSKRYKYIEENNESIVLSETDNNFICLMKDGSLFTIDKKDAKIKI